METMVLEHLNVIELKSEECNQTNGGGCTASWIGYCLCGAAAATVDFIMAVPGGIAEGLQSGVNAWK